MTKAVCCTINNSEGLARLISTAEIKFRIIDFQWEIILAGKVPGIHRLGYIRSENEHIWIADFSDSKPLSQIDAGNHTPAQGIFRIQQIVGVLLKAEDYLFRNYQAYLNPEAIRFSVGNSTFDVSVSIVFLPLDLDVDHDQYTLITLLKEIAIAYEIPEKQTETIISIYETDGLIRLDSMLAAESMKSAAQPDRPFANPINNQTFKKNSDKFSDKFSDKRLIKNIWLLSHIIWLSAAVISLIRPGMLSSLISRNLFLTLMLIIGIILAAHDTLLMLRSKAVRSAHEAKADVGGKRTAAKISRRLKNKGAYRKIQPDYNVENQTEIVERQDSSFRMAMLSQGLPGTPEELEGIRAFILLDEFIVGREESAADLWLASSTVGRRHARICRREGSFFITDLGSRNGTFLDGRKLHRNEDCLLPDRCRITFADQSYYFQAD